MQLKNHSCNPYAIGEIPVATHEQLKEISVENHAQQEKSQLQLRNPNCDLIAIHLHLKKQLQPIFK
jgi:hypothetical protein